MTCFQRISKERADELMPDTGRGRSRWKLVGEAALEGPVLVPVQEGEFLGVLQSNAQTSLRRWWKPGTFTLAQAKDGSGLIVRLKEPEATS